MLCVCQGNFCLVQKACNVSHLFTKNILALKIGFFVLEIFEDFLMEVGFGGPYPTLAIWAHGCMQHQIIPSLVPQDWARWRPIALAVHFSLPTKLLQHAWSSAAAQAFILRTTRFKDSLTNTRIKRITRVAMKALARKPLSEEATLPGLQLATTMALTCTLHPGSREPHVFCREICMLQQVLLLLPAHCFLDPKKHPRNTVTLARRAPCCVARSRISRRCQRWAALLLLVGDILISMHWRTYFCQEIPIQQGSSSILFGLLSDTPAWASLSPKVDSTRLLGAKDGLLNLMILFIHTPERT